MPCPAVAENYFEFSFKGIVHPKMKIQSLSSQTHADGRAGEVYLFHKTLPP